MIEAKSGRKETSLLTCQPDTSDAACDLEPHQTAGDAGAGGGAHDELVPVHGDHAEGEGGGEAEHEREEGRDAAQGRGVGQDPAVGENLGSFIILLSQPLRKIRPE